MSAHHDPDRYQQLLEEGFASKRIKPPRRREIHKLEHVATFLADRQQEPYAPAWSHEFELTDPDGFAFLVLDANGTCVGICPLSEDMGVEPHVEEAAEVIAANQ